MSHCRGQCCVCEIVSFRQSRMTSFIRGVSSYILMVLGRGPLLNSNVFYNAEHSLSGKIAMYDA